MRRLSDFWIIIEMFDDPKFLCFPEPVHGFSFGKRRTSQVGLATSVEHVSPQWASRKYCVENLVGQIAEWEVQWVVFAVTALTL